MFRDAAAFYEPLLVTVLLPVDGRGLDPQGRGVMITQDHVLTAWHVVQVVVGAGSYPFVRCARGTWICDVTWHHTGADMAVLRLRQPIREQQDAAHLIFPELANEMLQLGDAVAFMCELKTLDSITRQENDAPSLQVAVVSRRELPVENHPRFRLTAGYTISGFSGAPLFYADKRLVGVHVQSHDGIATVEDVTIPVLFAVESPIQPVRTAILDHIT